MKVSKIFMTLITIVVCVVIGAIVLNVLLPNATKQLLNAGEDMIYSATGLSFDFNNDSDGGGTTTGEYTGEGASSSEDETTNAAVDGFN